MNNIKIKIGIYTTVDSVDDMLNQYKELYPNEIIKVFEIRINFNNEFIGIIFGSFKLHCERA